MNREIIFRGKPVGKGGIWVEGIGAYKTRTAEHITINAKGASRRRRKCNQSYF